MPVQKKPETANQIKRPTCLIGIDPGTHTGVAIKESGQCPARMRKQKGRLPKWNAGASWWNAEMLGY